MNNQGPIIIIQLPSPINIAHHFLEPMRNTTKTKTKATTRILSSVIWNLLYQLIEARS